MTTIKPHVIMFGVITNTFKCIYCLKTFIQRVNAHSLIGLHVNVLHQFLSTLKPCSMVCNKSLTVWCYNWGLLVTVCAIRTGSIHYIMHVAYCNKRSCLSKGRIKHHIWKEIVESKKEKDYRVKQCNLFCSTISSDLWYLKGCVWTTFEKQAWVMMWWMIG